MTPRIDSKDDDCNAICGLGPRHDRALPRFIQFLQLTDNQQVGLHYIVSLTNESYGSATSISRIKDSLNTGWKGIKNNDEWTPPVRINNPTTDTGMRKANATFVILGNASWTVLASSLTVHLARNSDLNGVVTSIKQMEDRFNKRYHYPYVLLNEEPFDQKFKEYVSLLPFTIID